MLSAPTPLLLDFLEWLATGVRPYDEVMEAWRTSCPRLTVWEDAREAGYVVRVRGEAGVVVQLTHEGRAFLAEFRQAAA
jgi:D-3-phosphoglycerate dehydrogenase